MTLVSTIHLEETVRQLEGIAAACERAYTLSRSDDDHALQSGEYPFALGYVWAQTLQALEQLRKVTGVEDGRQAASDRAFMQLQAFRRALASEFCE